MAPNTRNQERHITQHTQSSRPTLKPTQTHPNTLTQHHDPRITIYGHILHDDRTTGSNHTIHAYSKAPYRARRDSLEVAWGVHIHRCRRKHSPSLICTKCQSPLTNTHILGGCRFTAKLRIKRHNSTFKLLIQHLQKSNGGRWPILCANMGHKSATDFSNLTPDIDPPPPPTLSPPRHQTLNTRRSTR